MGGGAQELRDRCEVPIALLRVDMPEVDREVGEQRLHVQTLLIPALHPGHREGMAQRGQARGAPAMGWRDGHAPAQPCEPIMEGTMLHGLSPFGHEKCVLQSIVVQVGALGLVVYNVPRKLDR